MTMNSSAIIINNNIFYWHTIYFMLILITNWIIICCCCVFIMMTIPAMPSCPLNPPPSPTAAARAEITSLRAAVAAQDGSLSQLQARVCGLEQQLQVCTRARTQNQYKNVTVDLTAPSLPFSVQPGGLRCQSIPHFSGKKFASHRLMLPMSPL